MSSYVSKKIKNVSKGSFTIEAALLTPIIFFVLLFVIYISFFLYNREAATVIVSQAALKGVQMEQEGKNMIEKEVLSFLQEETEQRLIFITSADYEVKVTLTHVTVKLQLTQASPYKDMNCVVSQKMSRLHPVSFLWETERLK